MVCIFGSIFLKGAKFRRLKGESSDPAGRSHPKEEEKISPQGDWRKACQRKKNHRTPWRITVKVESSRHTKLTGSEFWLE